MLLDAFGHRARMDSSFTGSHYLDHAFRPPWPRSSSSATGWMRLRKAPPGSPSPTSAAPSPSCQAGSLLEPRLQRQPAGHEGRRAQLPRHVAHGWPISGRRARRHVPASRRRARRDHHAVGEHCAAAGVRLSPSATSRGTTSWARPASAGSRSADERLAQAARACRWAAPSSSRLRAPCASSAWPRRSRTKGRRARAMGASAPAMARSSSIDPPRPLVRVNEIGQNIREEAPRVTRPRGIPTMGGVPSASPCSSPTWSFSRFSRRFAHPCSLLGGQRDDRLRDARIKIVRKRPGSLGVLQAVAATAAVAVIGFVALRFVGVYHGGGRALCRLPAETRHLGLLRAPSSTLAGSPTR